MRNGLIRDFFPKVTDFSTIANAEVAKIERLRGFQLARSLIKVLCAGYLNPRTIFPSNSAVMERVKNATLVAHSPPPSLAERA